MVTTIAIRNPKYYREFDDSDNECCWQVDLIGADIEAILASRDIHFDPMYEDWGASFTWTNSVGVEHSLLITCVDVEKATYSLDADAYRRRWFFVTPSVPVDESDFAFILPLLRQLLSPSRQMG